MFSTFMKIHKKINTDWNKKILEIFNNKYISKQNKLFSSSFISINFGFTPYKLIDGSGARISVFDKEPDNTYIKDPELSYMKSLGNGNNKTIFCSITEKIDDLFDLICNTINEKLGGYTGLRFFLRRTIAGCEFGCCLDFDITNTDLSQLPANCLFDKEPMILFTIHVKNKGPILAGILVILLVYAAKLALFIFEGGIAVVGQKIAQLSIKSIVKFLAEQGLECIIEKLFESISNLLIAKLESQIENLKGLDDAQDIADILAVVASIFAKTELENTSEYISDKISEKIGSKFKINAKVGTAFQLLFPHFFKLSVILVLCLVAFMMNFKFNLAIKGKNDYNIEQKAEQYQGSVVDDVVIDNEDVIENINPT